MQVLGIELETCNFFRHFSLQSQQRHARFSQGGEPGTCQETCSTLILLNLRQVSWNMD